MKKTITAIICQTDNYWYGWIKEIPGINCQEGTREELEKSIIEVLGIMDELNNPGTSNQYYWINDEGSRRARKNAEYEEELQMEMATA